MYSQSDDSPLLNWRQKAKLLGIGAGLGLLTFASYRYKVARPNEYLVRTGLGITDINVVKKGFQWPFQRMDRLTMTPQNYTFRLQAMSNEKMEFILPGVFTIGPHDESMRPANANQTQPAHGFGTNGLIRYARFLMGTNEERQREIIMGLIEGETRSMAAASSIEQIFKDRAIFRDKVTKNIGTELDKFGLRIFNSNIKELEDATGSEYFQYLRQRAREGAANQAKIDVAEAKYRGNVGEKDKERTTRIECAAFESQAVIEENIRAIEIAESKKELDVKRAEFNRQANIAKIEADKAAQIRELELLKLLEEANQHQNTASLRAKLVSDATAKAESHIKDTEGFAQAIRIKANADADAVRAKAEADLYAQQKNAEGIHAVYDAQASGIRNLIDAMNGDINGFLTYEMTQKDLLPRLAEANSKAIHGLNPKITIWNTGSGGTEQEYAKIIREVVKCVPPLFGTIKDQTGISFPDWVTRKDNGKDTLDVISPS